jgi:hypothetical protein
MSYKVEYDTVALMDNGTYGNVRQDSGHIYTDAKIAEIPTKLDDFLKPKKRAAIITQIVDVGGNCI